MKFRIGDKVKLINDEFGDTLSNPIWDGKHGNMEGTVYNVSRPVTDEHFCVMVKWPTTRSNSYREIDLDFVKSFSNGWDE